MIMDVPILIGPEQTIGDSEKYLLHKAKGLTSINYCYITDTDNKLKGIISIKDIFSQEKSTKLSQIMTRDLITVKGHTRIERASYLATSHNLKSIPVVDKEGKLEGVVSNDIILEALNQELHQHAFQRAGLPHSHLLYHADSVLTLPIITSVWHRIPWLIVGLLGGILISKIIHLFESQVAGNIVIASFIPLIVYMSDAISTQLESFVIRDFAINSKLAFLRYFTRQVIIVTIIGGILSYLFFFGVFFLYHDFKISMVMGASMFIAVISSMVTGLLIPFLFERMKFDPANASGPIGTIIQDSISVIIYLLIAASFL
jgi:magnesium transporter